MDGYNIFLKLTILNRLRFTLVTLFYLFKDPISKYSHILKYWGFGFQHVNLGGEDTIQSTHIFFCVFWIVALSHTHAHNTTALVDLEGNSLILVTWPFPDLCIWFWAVSASGISSMPHSILLCLRIHCFDFFRNVSKLWKLWTI